MSNINYQSSSNTGLLIPPRITERWELIGILVIERFEKLGKLSMMIVSHLIKRKR